MPIFKDHSQDGKLLSTREETLNVSNVTRYLEENGADVMVGYTDALTDFVRELDSIVYIQRPTSIGQQSDARIRAAVMKLLKDQEKFLDILKPNQTSDNAHSLK